MIEFRMIGDSADIEAAIEAMRRCLDVGRVSDELYAEGKPLRVRRYLYATVRSDKAAPPAAEPVELDGATIIALLTAKGADVNGWSFVATVAQPDLRGQHVVIRDEAGHHYATPSTGWDEAAAQDMVVFTPVRVHPQVLHVTRYELIGGDR